jgi:DNA polymerase elongation subunit (family B)
LNESDVADQKDFYRGRKAKVLILDYEVSEVVATTYDVYRGPSRRILKNPQIIAVAWKFRGESKIHSRILPDYKGYKVGLMNLDDRKLCEEVYDVMKEADVIVGHNIKKFDLTVARTRFFEHGFKPTKEWGVEDTLQILWSQFKLPRNTLDEACKFVGIKGKGKQRHSDFVDGCYDGEMKDWKGMQKYNINDVEITEAFYEKIGPWNPRGVNYNLYARQGNACPFCGMNKALRNGARWNKTNLRQRYECQSCGKGWTGESIATTKEGTLELVNQSR